MWDEGFTKLQSAFPTKHVSQERSLVTPLRRAAAGSVPPDGLRGRQQGRAFLPRGTIPSNQEATLGAVHRTAGTCQGVGSGTGGEMGAGLWAWRNDS